MGLNWKRVGLGALAAIGAIGGIVLDYQENEQSKKDQINAAEKAAREEANKILNKNRNKGKKSH